MLNRPTCRARYYCGNSVHLSIRPSNAGIVSKQMHIVTLFRLSGRGIILVFEPSALTKFQEEPISGGREINTSGVEKSGNYRPPSRKRYEIDS